jgi:hypothetical protein
MFKFPADHNFARIQFTDGSPFDTEFFDLLATPVTKQVKADAQRGEYDYMVVWIDAVDPRPGVGNGGGVVIGGR